MNYKHIDRLFDSMYPLFLEDLDKHFDEEVEEEKIISNKSIYEEDDVTRMIKHHLEGRQKR